MPQRVPSQKVRRMLRLLDRATSAWHIPVIGRAKGRVIRRLIERHRPTRALEIGSLLGYSAILIASALPPRGRLTCIEVNPFLASLVKANADEAGLGRKVKVVVGRVNYSEEGTGECASSAESSIYDVPATQWHVTYGGDGSNIQHLNLTVWRPRAGGPDMVGLHLQSGEISHEIATVKGGPLKGSGAAGVRPAGKGGILNVSGQDADGHPLELTVECERFDEVVAEGG